MAHAAKEDLTTYGRDFPGDNDGRWAILHAISQDGVHWQVDPEPVLTGEAVGMEDALNPEVLRLPDGRFWMAFSARVEHSHFHLFLAYSDAGLSWRLLSRKELLPHGEGGGFDERAVNHPALLQAGSEDILRKSLSDDGTGGRWRHDRPDLAREGSHL